MSMHAAADKMSRIPRITQMAMANGLQSHTKCYMRTHFHEVENTHLIFVRKN
jgi:hypothetical protein